MKVLIYSHDWAPLPGGIQTMTMALARRLALETTEKIDVTLVTQTPRGTMNDEVLPFRVVRRPKFWQLVRLARNADVIHLAGAALLPLIISRLLHKPAILEHHGYQSVCPNGLLLYVPNRTVCPGHFMARRYMKCLRCNSQDMGRGGSLRALLLTFPRRWLAKRASRNVAPSLHLSQRTSLPNTQLIYHGVRDAGASPLSSSNGNRVVFAYVGRLVMEKGVPILLRAAAQLRQDGYDVRVKIIGDGTDRVTLEEMAVTLGLGNSIQFLGHIPVESIPNHLVGVTAVVVPSICEDVAPLAVSEQLMLGNIVIASDIGGLAELLGDAGLTFRAGDPDSLVRRMRDAVDNPERMSQMRANARKRACQYFSEDRMLAEHLRAYRSLLEDRR